MRGIDSWILYTTDPDAFWRSLRGIAGDRGARLSGDPPSVSVEVTSDCRLYCEEASVDELGEAAPAEVERLGPTARAIVVDRHNRMVAGPFFGAVVRRVEGFVEDDADGWVVPTARFAAVERTSSRGS